MRSVVKVKVTSNRNASGYGEVLYNDFVHATFCLYFVSLLSVFHLVVDRKRVRTIVEGLCTEMESWRENVQRTCLLF
jgi:hypothetical protein